jgi:hypothetical protein
MNNKQPSTIDGVTKMIRLHAKKRLASTLCLTTLGKHLLTETPKRSPLCE